MYPAGSIKKGETVLDQKLIETLIVNYCLGNDLVEAKKKKEWNEAKSNYFHVLSKGIKRLKEKWLEYRPESEFEELQTQMKQAPQKTFSYKDCVKIAKRLHDVQQLSQLGASLYSTVKKGEKLDKDAYSIVQDYVDSKIFP